MGRHLANFVDALKGFRGTKKSHSELNQMTRQSLPF